MAQVVKNSKILRGKVGNLVFGIFNGKEVVSLRPGKYKKSTSPEAIKNKKRFAAVVTLAKFVNKLPELSKLWETSGLKGNNNYMKILNANLPLTDQGDLSDKNIIVPPGGFHNPISDIIFSENKLTINFSYSENDLPLLKNRYNLYLIFYKSETNYKQKLVPQINMQILNDIELLDSLEITLNSSLEDYFVPENNTVIFSTLVSKEVPGKETMHSTTFAIN
jgi:hypothetical protein